MFLSEAQNTLQILADNLYQIIIMIALLALQSIGNWIKNVKPKKEMKLTLEQLASNVKVIDDKVTTCSHDIKDCKDSIQSVRVQQRARLEFQLNASPDMYLLFNEDGECTFANEALCTFVERPKELLLYTGWIDIIHPQAEKERVIDLFDKAVGRQIAFDVDTSVYTYNSRKTYPVCISAKPIWDDEGNPLWYSCKVVKIITNGQ